MEDYKKQGGVYSSFTADVFGFKESPPNSSSNGVFASIFAPPSTVSGKKSSGTEVMGSLPKHSSGNHVWSSKHETTSLHSNPASCGKSKYENTIFQEVAEPCNLSSSLYYGGQENYARSPSAQAPATHPVFKSDDGEDDDHNASRGNWWQGSLYY